MTSKEDCYKRSIFEVAMPCDLLLLKPGDYDLIIIDEVDEVVTRNRIYEINGKIILFPDLINSLLSPVGRVVGFSAAPQQTLLDYGSSAFNWSKQKHFIPLQNKVDNTLP
jgi:hypothetical protein